MVRPEIPKIVFDLKEPTLRDLEYVIRRKRNGATPGINGLPYLIYKKCPSTLRVLRHIFSRIWKSGEVPSEWGIAFVILLPKSDNLSNLDEFRPIAITNTNGKIFFSVISDRLQRYMISNELIKRQVQKGFLSGVSGCLEHFFSLHEALREANTRKHAIVVSWLVNLIKWVLVLDVIKLQSIRKINVN